MGQYKLSLRELYYFTNLEVLKIKLHDDYWDYHLLTYLEEVFKGVIIMKSIRYLNF